MSKRRTHPLAKFVRGNFKDVRLIKVKLTLSIIEALVKYHNKNNRKISRSQTNKFERIIRAGEFCAANPATPIIVDTNGNVLNGQHRLAGMLQARKAITMYVTFGCHPKYYADIDVDTKRRTAVDYMHKLGYKHFTLDHQAVTRFFVKGFKASNGQTGAMTFKETKDAYLRNREAIDFAVDTLSVPRNHVYRKGLGRAGLRAALAIAYQQPGFKTRIRKYAAALTGDASGDIKIDTAAGSQRFWLQEYAQASFAQAAQVELLNRSLYHIKRMVSEARPVRQYSPKIPSELTYFATDTEVTGRKAPRSGKKPERKFRRKGGARRTKVQHAALRVTA